VIGKGADDDQLLFVIVQEVDAEQVLRIITHTQMIIQVAVCSFPTLVFEIRNPVFCRGVSDRVIPDGLDLKRAPIFLAATGKGYVLRGFI
jgi:hypothetical protein